jgi:hypothetical protein
MSLRGRDQEASLVIKTNITGAGIAPACPPQMMLAAAADVEWSKNYRARNGNVPFCYSVTWLAVPAGDGMAMDAARFWYRSAYVQDASQTASLVASAGEALAGLLIHAGLIAGHQLCSDLAVLAAHGGVTSAGITAARAAWRCRRQPVPGGPRILDTRYDTGHLLTGRSRRLVDVCAELGLDVTQPELRTTSMTALHRRWLLDGDIAAREKITVLNLRHALSTTLIAVRTAGLGHWQPGLNVSRLLANGLDGTIGWLADPAFTALLGGPGAT